MEVYNNIINPVLYVLHSHTLYKFRFSFFSSPERKAVIGLRQSSVRRASVRKLFL